MREEEAQLWRLGPPFSCTQRFACAHACVLFLCSHLDTKILLTFPSAERDTPRSSVPYPHLFVLSRGLGLRFPTSGGVENQLDDSARAEGKRRASHCSRRGGVRDGLEVGLAQRSDGATVYPRGVEVITAVDSPEFEVAADLRATAFYEDLESRQALPFPPRFMATFHREFAQRERKALKLRTSRPSGQSLHCDCLMARLPDLGLVDASTCPLVAARARLK